MAKAPTKFTQYVDPGRTWLKVPLTELDRLGISDSISTNSRIRGNFAFLDVKYDKAVFDQARVANNEPYVIANTITHKNGLIKKYDMFGGDRMVTRVNIMSGKEFQERVDTPYYLSPSSETYWSR